MGSYWKSSSHQDSTIRQICQFVRAELGAIPFSLLYWMEYTLTTGPESDTSFTKKFLTLRVLVVIVHTCYLLQSS